MRPSLIALGSILLTSCSWPVGSTSKGAGGGDAGVDCPETEACADCVQCALASPCQELYQTCLASLACKTIDQCFAQCDLDKSCQQDCLTNHPSGAADYDALITCVTCETCPTACAGQCL